MLETPAEFRRRVGTIEGGPELVFRTRGEVMVRGVVAVTLVGVFVAGARALVALSPWPTWATVAAAVAGLTLYCSIGFFLRPRPNHDELSSPFGNPFRLSDDVNGALLTLLIVLAPARFVSVSLVDGALLLTRGQLPQERYIASRTR